MARSTLAVAQAMASALPGAVVRENADRVEVLRPGKKPGQTLFYICFPRRGEAEWTPGGSVFVNSYREGVDGHKTPLKPLYQAALNGAGWGGLGQHTALFALRERAAAVNSVVGARLLRVALQEYPPREGRENIPVLMIDAAGMREVPPQIRPSAWSDAQWRAANWAQNCPVEDGDDLLDRMALLVAACREAEARGEYPFAPDEALAAPHRAAGKAAASAVEVFLRYFGGPSNTEDEWHWFSD